MLCAAGLYLNPQKAFAQTPAADATVHDAAQTDEQVMLEINERLQHFIEDITTFSLMLHISPVDSLAHMERLYRFMDSRWQTFYQAQQMDIATDEDMMNMAASYQVTNQNVIEDLQKLKERAEGMEAYHRCTKLLKQELPHYKDLYKEAIVLSLTPKLAPKLEQLKGKEQLTFADIQTSFGKAKNALVDDAASKNKLKKLEEQYIKLKNISDKIQAAEYKPLLQRFKDELMGLAAITILLMFVSMVVSRIQAFRNARKAAKKFGNMFNNNQQYPTI